MSSVAGGSGGSTGKKTAWPEVVGLSAEAAAKVIKRDMPEADIVVVTSDEDTTLDLVPDRVRIVVDTVAVTPTAELVPAGRKSSWPEVVGMSVEEAKEAILRDKHDADIVVLPVGAPATSDDLKPNRVRLFIDTVAVRPFVG